MLDVFEGPLCCNTGVCGSDPDQALVDFTADVNWLAHQGVPVRRANLAQDPQVFADSEVARAFLSRAGIEGLPLLVVDGVTVMAGRYPTRAELARFVGIAAPAEAGARTSAGASSTASCCAPADKADGAACCCAPSDQAADTTSCCTPTDKTTDTTSCCAPTDKSTDTASCCAPSDQAAGACCCGGPEPVSIQARPQGAVAR